MEQNKDIQTEYEQQGSAEALFEEFEAAASAEKTGVYTPVNAVSEGENSEAPKASSPKRKRRKRRRKHYLLRFLVFAGICTGLYYFAMSDFFSITGIEVQGNRYYTKSQVMALSQIKTGFNLFTTDLQAGKENLLADPYIRLASVKRVLPGTVAIEVEERTEYAAIPYGEQYILIDEDGMVLRLTDTQPVLPQLDGMIINEMTPGSPLGVEQAYLLTDTLEMISVMEENDLYFKTINFSLVIVKAYIYDDYYIEGTPENITENMKRIHQLIEEHYKQGIVRGVIRVSKGNYMAFDPQIE